jgi:hypothetical protein
MASRDLKIFKLSPVTQHAAYDFISHHSKNYQTVYDDTHGAFSAGFRLNSAPSAEIIENSVGRPNGILIWKSCTRLVVNHYTYFFLKKAPLNTHTKKTLENPYGIT